MNETIFTIIAWLGGAFFCGILPLGFAAVLFFTARKRRQVSSSVSAMKMTSIAALRPGADLIRVQGRIASTINALDGSPENALVYLRLKMDVYEIGSESSGWKTLTVKSRGIPFRLEDSSGAVWVNPEGLDKELLGDGVSPNNNQIQAACTLLGLSPRMLPGQLRFKLWELRAGQTVSVIGGVAQGQNGLEIAQLQGSPFIVSPLLGPILDAKISSQLKTARTWMFLLGIPGALFLLCGLGGALVSLVSMLTKR